jgi:hypothetical protein
LKRSAGICIVALFHFLAVLSEAQAVEPGLKEMQGMLGSLDEGTRLRFVLTDSSTVHGLLEATFAETLLLRTDVDGEQSVKLGDIRAVFQLRHSKRKGQTIGLVIGGTLGAALLYAALRRTPDAETNARAGDAGVAIVIGGGVGVALGAVIGTLVSRGTDVWVERYPRDRAKHVWGH